MYLYYIRDGLIATELYPQDRANRDEATHNLAEEKVCPRSAGLKWALSYLIGTVSLASQAQQGLVHGLHHLMAGHFKALQRPRPEVCLGR
jgi:hypothetical protein